MRCPRCHRRIGLVARCPLHGGGGAGAEEIAAAEPPPAVEGFEDLALLGAGGFARVYSARRTEDGARLALKVARTRGDPRFAREAAALRRLGAPAAPALLGEATSAEGAPVLVLELLRGEPLSRW